MNVKEYMEKYGLRDKDLDNLSKPYEQGDYKNDPTTTVHTGSHLDAVGKRRITVIYDAADTQKIASIARSRGVKQSDVYRDALNFYLQAHG